MSALWWATFAAAFIGGTVIFYRVYSFWFKTLRPRSYENERPLFNDEETAEAADRWIRKQAHPVE